MLTRRKAGSGRDSSQTSLFPLLDDGRGEERGSGGPGAEVLAALRAQDANELTPLQALNLIADWRRRLRDEEPSETD